MGWGSKGEHLGGVCRGLERRSGVGMECYNKTVRSIESWETSCGPADMAGKVFLCKHVTKSGMVVCSCDPGAEGWAGQRQVGRTSWLANQSS